VSRKATRTRFPEALCALLLAALLLAPCFFVRAQQPARIPRIGYLDAVSLTANPARIEAFRQGLRKLGYVERKNMFIEWRSADGKLDRLPALTAELLDLNVDIIVSGGRSVTRAAKEATSTIPIIMTQDSDPVANGFVTSLARPGGNITGLSTLAPELSGKRLELMKEIIPKLSRVAVFGSSTTPDNAQSLREVELAARTLKVELQNLDILDPRNIDAAFRSAINGRADAVMVLTGAVFDSRRREIVDLARQNRLPAIYYKAEFVEDGGLMTYGTSWTDLSRRAATYVDKILKGAKPADLPVEQPTKFELIINLKAANQIGLTIPPNVLVRADRVLK
jgi:ABC-type uncharacterized transport system substrate-binding protein